MQRWEKITISLYMGAIPPLIGLFTGWWGSYLSLPESKILPYALLGLLVGFIVDALWLKRWLYRAHKISLGFWALLYAIYSICVFGFFMGVPVFNVFLGICAGAYMGGRSRHKCIKENEKMCIAKGTAAFTTCILFIICIISAALALRDPYTGANLQGMLGLQSEVNKSVIYAIIFVGGAILLTIQYWVTYLTYIWVEKRR